MMRRILTYSLKFFVASALLFGGSLFSQVSNSNPVAKTSKARLTGDDIEELMKCWTTGIGIVYKHSGISNDDFQTFIRFNEVVFDSEKYGTFDAINAGRITFDNARSYRDNVIKEWTERLNKFLKIKAEYPSSVAEFDHDAKMPASLSLVCNPACDNIDFASGTLNGWYGYYAENSSSTVSYRIHSWTGGACGAVTQAGGPDPHTGSDYQIKIMTGTGVDAFCPAVPIVSPYATSPYCVRLGDSTMNEAGVAILAQRFRVNASNANFTYQYAVLLENPGHTYYQQPFFKAALLDSAGDTIPFCGSYTVVSGTGLKGFKGYYYANRGDTIYVRDWTVVAVPLKKYIGQCVTIIFEVADCALTGHAGWAYVTCSCAPLGLISSSPALCGQKTITLTAPPGATKYAWTGPTGGIVGSDSTQTITVDSSGKYTVILTPVTGSSCNDTITDSVGKAPGPPPKPSFHADTICAGQPTTFTNTSNPISGANFYWDFYNIGSYQDTVDVNPVWTYSTPGTYTVKLEETYKGCGYDTLIKVKVDSTVAGKFTATTACVKQTVFFNNLSTGATKYYWNFGDPSSGTSDTSTTTNPTHVYDTAGTYLVTFVAKNGGPCPDTIRTKVTVLAIPKVTVTGQDSICPGGTASFTATATGGATSYTWTTGVTCPSCAATSANPTVTTTYTVTASNGFCSGDTTWTVYVKTPPVATIIAKPDTICIGDSATLIGTGGGSYIWTFSGSTKDSIKVGPTSTTTYTLQVTGPNGCAAVATKQVVVEGTVATSIILRQDSICPYDSTYLVALGGSKYKWLPSGATTDSIKAKTGVTTTYSVVITTACGVDTLSKTLHIVPVPKVTTSPNPTICTGSSTSISVNGGAGVTYLWSTGATTSAINTGSLSGNQTYTCKVSNGKCYTDTSITVHVVDKPNPTITPPQKVCNGTTVTLCATDTAKGLSYKWNTGATTSCITVTPGGGTTTYSVAVSNGSCIDSSGTSITVDVPGISACCDTSIIRGDTVSINAYNDSTYSWSPTSPATLSCYTCPDPVASPTVTTTYTVTGVDKNGCPASTTVTIVVEVPCADFEVPNIFTPNNDGINDDFVPFYYVGGVLHNGIMNPSAYSIIIYDRWGKTVYSSSDPTVYWNGRITGTQNLVPDGVYYYIIKSTCGGNDYTKKGFVTVLGEH